MSDLSRLSDAELMQLLNKPDARADMPAAGAQDVAAPGSANLRGMSDAELLARRSMPAPEPPSVGEALWRGGAQGVTLGYGDELAGAVHGAASKLTGGDYLPAYRQTRDENRAANAAADKAHPWAYGGGKIAGNVAGAAPAFVMAPGLFGVGAGALGARMAASAVGGGLLGTVQGYGEGEGSGRDQTMSALAGMAGGAALGGVSPAGGQVVGKSVAPVAQRVLDRSAPIPGASEAAAGILAEDFANAGGRAAIDGRMGPLGPDARLYHAGPTFEGSAQALAIRPETREIVQNDVRGLRSGANDRLAADVDAAIGPAPVPSQVEAQFQAKRDALGPRYAQEEARARPLSTGETSQLWDLAENLAREQKGPGRQLLDDAIDLIAPRNARGLRMPDDTPQGLMQTRQALDGLIARVQEKPELQSAGVGARLQQIRQAVDDTVRAVNPEIKHLDRTFQTFSDASSRLNDGLNFMSRDVHPADVAARFDAAPFEQQAAERLGARARVDREMGNTNRDLVKLRDTVKTEGKWNYDKLSTYFGEDGARSILSATDREGAFEEVARRIVDNSMTAQRTEAAGRFRPRGEPTAADPTFPLASISGGVTGGPAGAMGSMALAAAVKGVRGAGLDAQRVADLARNKEIARILTLPAGPELDATLDALGRRAGLAGGGEAAGKYAGRLAQLVLTSNGNDAGQGVRRALGR